MNDDDNVFDVELYSGAGIFDNAIASHHVSDNIGNRIAQLRAANPAGVFVPDAPVVPPPMAPPAPLFRAHVPPVPVHNGITPAQENARQQALERDENQRMQRQISEREREDRERNERERAERVRRESIPYTTARPTYVSPYIVQTPVVHHYTNEYNPIVYRRLYDYGVGYIPTYYSYDQRRRAEYLLENLIKKELLAKVTEEELQKVIKTTLANTDTNGKIVETKEKAVRAARAIAKKTSKKVSKKKSKKTSKKKSKKTSKKKSKKTSKKKSKKST